MNICPFRNGDSKTLTTYESFKRSCVAYCKPTRKSAFNSNFSNVYPCLTCVCGKNFSSGKEVSIKNIPPWIVIVDDTKDKREILDSLTGKLKLKFVLLLIELAQKKHSLDLEENCVVDKEVTQKSKNRKQGSVVSQEERDAIYSYYINNSISTRALALKWGVSRSLINKILKEKRQESEHSNNRI